MNNRSTSGAMGTLVFKSISVRHFVPRERREMEGHMNSMFAEGWELVHCIPYQEYLPPTPNEEFQRVSTSFQVLMGKRD